MIEIGLLGLDTSHAEAFVSVLEGRDGVSLGGVWDSGEIRGNSYLESFCEEHNAPCYDEPAGMIDAVDAVMILTVDWDTHVSLAEPFLAAGIPTLLDKPVVGRIEDVYALAAASSGTPFFGGSAVPFHPQFDELPRGIPDRTLFAGGYNDSFYYRVHLSDTVRLFADADWTRVEPTGDGGTTLRIWFENGAHATLRFDGASDNGVFGVLDIAERTRAVEIPGNSNSFEELYEPYIAAFLETVRGERDECDRLLDSATLALAVEGAITENCAVTPDAATLRRASPDGSAFVEGYEPYY